MAEWPNCLRPPQNHFCYRSYPKLNPGKNSLGILTMTQFVKDKFEIKKSICYWSEEMTKRKEKEAGICPCKKYLNSNFQPFLLSQLLQSIFSLHMTREKNGLKWSWQFLQFVSRNGSCCWCVCVCLHVSRQEKCFNVISRHSDDKQLRRRCRCWPRWSDVWVLSSEILGLNKSTNYPFNCVGKFLDHLPSLKRTR